MSKPLDPLPDALRGLLERERGRTAIPDAARARLWQRLAPLALPPTSSRGRPRLRQMATGKLGVAALSAALGGATGALVQRAVDQAAPVTAPARLPPPSVPALVPVAPAAASPAVPVAPAAPALPERKRSPKPVAVPPSAVQTPAGPAPSPDSALAAERTLLDIARTALTRGDASSAATALERHAREFPRGALSEDREVLRIQVLLAQGDREEAQAAAQRFEAQYPRSFALPALKASLGETP